MAALSLVAAGGAARLWRDWQRELINKRRENGWVLSSWSGGAIGPGGPVVAQSYHTVMLFFSLRHMK